MGYCTIRKAEVSRINVVDKATGRQWDDGVITTLPTVSKEGVKAFTCTACKETKTEAIAKLTKPGIKPSNSSSTGCDAKKNDGKTGDAGITLYLGMALAAVLAGAVIVIRKRKEN